MAFEVANLTSLSYGNGFTMWHYKTDDNINEVSARNYFFGASNYMKDNDMVIVHSSKNYNNLIGFMDRGIWRRYSL